MSHDIDIERLQRLSGAKWNWFDDDVLPAWVADMDFPTAPAVIDALRDMVKASDLGYNAVSFDSSVARAWADWSERRYAWRPDVEAVRTFSSSLQPIAAALAAGTREGDGVVLFTPVYPPFFGMIEKAGRRVVEYPLEPEDWRIEHDVLAGLVDESTSAVLLCNPHNPTGRVFDRGELAAVAAVAHEHDLLVISDEIWQDLVYPGSSHVPFASLGADEQARTVTVTSASKSFSLGGLCCAVAHVGRQQIGDYIDALPPHLLGMVNALGATAAIAAWTGGGSWLHATLDALHSNRDHLAHRLTDELPQVRFAIPEATYLAWLDFRETGFGEDPAVHIAKAARVGLSCGPDFGSGGAGYARLNFATTREILDEIVDRIVAAT
jgi:cystathionine beta-lyase